MGSSRVTAVAALGPVAVGSLLWRERGSLHLTTIVKARYAMVHGAEMRLISPPMLVERDVHEGGDPTRSLRESSDFVPFRAQADVWLHGAAHTPGPPVSVALARLALYRRREVLVDKIVHVMGERASVHDAPTPFTRMPLRYEHAYGGVGHDENPVGTGADERPRPPNLLDPEDPKRTIGFGPISRYWKARRQSLGSHRRRDLEKGTVEIPDGFDWTYFQAAPIDQRVSYLEGGEWIVLDGMSAERVRFQTRLPKSRAVARLLRPDDDEGDAVALVADTLAIDVDGGTCCITWRGTTLVTDEAAVGRWIVAGAMQAAGEQIPWQHAHRLKVDPDEDFTETTALDRSGVTIVSDPPSVSRESLGSMGHTMVDTKEPSREVEPWPVYPLGGDEVTETKTTVDPQRPDMTERDALALGRDTERGAVPIDVDNLPWLEEDAVEPVAEEGGEAPPTDRAPDSGRSFGKERPRLSSTPPALDREGYARALRQAGASEADIASFLQQLDES